MMNHIVIGGRLTRDPDRRVTSNETPVTSFTLACDRDYKSDGVDFIDCVAWRGTADFVANYLTKGRLVFVEGRLQIRDWTDKSGGKRKAAEVVVSNVYFGDSKPKEASTEPPELREAEDDGELPF